MNVFAKKSSDMMDAAEVLQDSSCFTSIPHCAYYACHQIVRSIWFNVLGKDEDDIDNAISNSSTRTGVHEVLNNEITQHILSINQNDGLSFKNEIAKLKKLRIDADYQEIVINQNEATKAINYAKNIIRTLNNYQQ